MKKELTEQLYLRFPTLFSGRDKPLTESLMSLGFECRDGWFKLIYNLCEDLEMIAYEGCVHVPEVVQVKEKFGGLRLYIQSGTKRTFERIDKAQDESKYICEICGEKGKLFTNESGRMKTRCNAHRSD